MIHTEKRTPVNIRVLPAQRLLIDSAAAALQKSRAEFILEAACQVAENVVLDQRHFFLNDKDYAAFEQALNAPVSPSLRALMETEAPWEQQ